jgi:chemotaxis protein CheX
VTAICPTTQVDPAYWEVIVSGLSEVFSTTCGATPQAADLPAENADDMIMGVVSLVGDVEWSLFLGLPRPTATAAAAKFAGFEIPFDSQDMGDAIGELANIFAGKVKALLDAKKVRVEISLPSVLRAKDVHVLAPSPAAASAKGYFKSEIGAFYAGMLTGRPHHAT